MKTKSSRKKVLSLKISTFNHPILLDILWL